MKKNKYHIINSLDRLFAKKHSNVLNIYLTAGYPSLDSTPGLMLALQEAGADIIEIGIPYSDPLADGPVIQQSNQKAIENGMNMDLMFRQLAAVNNSIQIPVILMGYLNSALNYGFEEFCRQASLSGVSAVILPDMPFHEFEKTYKDILGKYGLHFIFLVTPETSEKRMAKADKLSSGFLYAVSSSSVTGTNTSGVSRLDYFERINNAGLRNPVLIGFGIHDKQSFDLACSYANGAIIGSAFIRSIGDSEDPAITAREFIHSIRGK